MISKHVLCLIPKKIHRHESPHQVKHMTLLNSAAGPRALGRPSSFTSLAASSPRRPRMLLLSGAHARSLSQVWLLATLRTVCSPPGSSIHVILQARILEWGASFYSRGSSQPRDQTCVSCVSCFGRQILYHWAMWAPRYTYAPFTELFSLLTYNQGLYLSLLLGKTFLADEKRQMLLNSTFFKGTPLMATLFPWQQKHWHPCLKTVFHIHVKYLLF